MTRDLRVCIELRTNFFAQACRSHWKINPHLHFMFYSNGFFGQYGQHLTFQDYSYASPLNLKGPRGSRCQRAHPQGSHQILQVPHDLDLQ